MLCILLLVFVSDPRRVRAMFELMYFYCICTYHVAMLIKISEEEEKENEQ